VWTELESGRRVKAYTLTRSGRAQLAKEKRNWRKVFTAMNQVLAEDS
jgi:DNA-binding PadR family transcriptional regulator